MTDNTSVSSHPANILVIDDEEIVHASLKRILGRAGYQVTGVYSAKEALSLVSSRHYDLTIVDLMMPEMNGIQFLENLREQQSQLPVLMVTGYPTIGTAVHALKLGAVDYIAKPFSRKELLGPVQRALSSTADGVHLPDGETAQPMTKEKLKPGDICVLPRHAWARFQQDGTFLIGIEDAFLRICQSIKSVYTPEEMDLIEQGYVGVYLENEEREQHGVAMPLSGQVVEVNRQVIEDPDKLAFDSWIICIIPTHLDVELGRLLAL